MTHNYVDIATVHNPATGTVAPAAWGDAIRDNQELFIDPPACSVFNSTVQSVANVTPTALTADSESFDNDSMHSTVSATSRITIQTAGRYQFMTTILYAADVDGARAVRFQIDGTTDFGVVQLTVGTTAQSIGMVTVGTALLSAGQYVEVNVNHTAGNNLDVTLREFTALFLTR